MMQAVTSNAHRTAGFAKRSLRAALVGVSMLATGCPVIAELRKEDAMPVSVGFTRERVATPEMTEKKLGLFMRCRTSLASVINESWTHYTTQVDEETGRTKRRVNRLYLHAIDKTALRTCTETLNEARNLVPELPETVRRFDLLFDAAKAHAAVTRALDELLTTAPEEQGTWVAVFHPLLRTSYERWAYFDKILDLELDDAKGENDPKLLELLAAAGDGVELRSRRLIITSRPYVRCAVGSEATSEACAPAFGDFDLAFISLEAWLEEHPKDASGVFWLAVFLEDAAAFHDAARALQEHRGGLHSDSRETAAPELAALDEAYRNLQRSADILDFEFP